MRRPSPSTLALVVLAGGSVAAVHFDPWADEGAVAPLVSTKSNARRLLPEIQDRGADGATIELMPVHGEPTRIVPTASHTHEVWAGDVPLGPADPEAVEGLWASLRMATTLRAVEDDAASDPGDGGRIRVMLGDAVHELWLGRPSPDGAGLYGGRVAPPEGVEGTWVVEREVGDLLEQAPRAWLAVRALVVEPAQVDAVAFSDGLVLRRGADDAWRSELASVTAILSDTAVEHRLQRLVTARLDPLLPPETAPVDTTAGPWLSLHAEGDRDFALWLGGACPGRPERVLVARGPGLVGCMDAALTEPWPAVGRGRADDAALLDAHLLPPAYGRVLSIEQSAPHARTLARHGGDWRIEESGSGAVEVEESEVFRWYEGARAIEVDISEQAPTGEPDLDLVFALDSATQLRLRCAGRGESMRCRRDDGPWLSLTGSPPELAFEAATFRDRRLVDLSVDDVRALEMLPGEGSDEARQGAHFDLGVWRLDAPIHPAGDDALDEDRLQGMLAALAGARIEAWLEPGAARAPLRTFRIDRTPRRGQDATVVVELLPDCTVRVPGGAPGRISEGTCASLSGDLLRADAVAALLLDARSVEVAVGEAAPVRLHDREGTLAREDDAPLGAMNDVLEELRRIVVADVLEGRPPGTPRMRLRIRPRRGEPYELEVGEGSLSFTGASWWMRTELAADDD